jgi:hypothetical protein
MKYRGRWSSITLCQPQDREQTATKVVPYLWAQSCRLRSGNIQIPHGFPLLLDEELLSGGLYVAFESMGEATTSDDGVLGLWVSGSWADPSRGVIKK